MNKRIPMLAMVVLLVAALACSGGGSKGSGGGFGDAPASDRDGEGGLTARSSGEGLGNEEIELDRGDRAAGEGDLPGGGQFELPITEEALASGLTAAFQQTGTLSGDAAVEVDIRSDETVVTRYPYTIEETGNEVTAELVYTVFVEVDSSLGVEVVSASFKTAQGLSLDLPAERMDALNAAIEETIATYSDSAAEMSVTWTDIVYSDTQMTLVGSVER